MPQRKANNVRPIGSRGSTTQAGLQARGGHQGVPKGSYADRADKSYTDQVAELRRHVRFVLREAMRDRGMTHQQVADYMGISVGALRDRLNGVTNIPVEEAVALATMLRLPLTVLTNPNATLRELRTFSGRYVHGGEVNSNTPGTLRRLAKRAKGEG